MRIYRALMALAGAAIIGYGLYGLLTEPQIKDPLDILVWAGGAVVLHDGLWLPLVCLIGAAAARDAILRFGLIVAASVTVVALPAVLRAGDQQGNPTVLPLPYLRNLLLLLLGCALATAAAWTVRWLRGRRERASTRSPGASEDPRSR
jgi:hypothetical protein